MVIPILIFAVLREARYSWHTEGPMSILLAIHRAARGNDALFDACVAKVFEAHGELSIEAVDKWIENCDAVRLWLNAGGAEQPLSLQDLISEPWRFYFPSRATICQKCGHTREEKGTRLFGPGEPVSWPEDDKCPKCGQMVPASEVRP